MKVIYLCYFRQKRKSIRIKFKPVRTNTCAKTEKTIKLDNIDEIFYNVELNQKKLSKQMKVKTLASKTTDYNTIRKDNPNDIIEINNEVIEENFNNNNNENNEILDLNNKIKINNDKNNINPNNNTENNDNNIDNIQPNIQATTYQPGFKVSQNLEESQIEFIKNILISNGFTDEFDLETITEFAIGFFSIEFDEGRIIFEENDEAKLFYIIEEGKIKLTSERNKTEKILKRENFFFIF